MKPVTVFVPLAINVGLAIVGWGGLDTFFSHPVFVAFVVMTLALGIAALFSGGNLNAGEREDRGNRWVVGVFIALGLVLAYVPAYTDRRNLLTLDGDSVRWAGFVLYTIGGCLRLWPVFVLGSRFSGLVAIQHGHTLVTTGIYRYVRNPSYLGLLMGSLGWALVFRSVLGIIITALLLVPLVARIDAEERLLSGRFGAEYERYRGRTWRLIPGIY
jgi:protein-S-isoprenylcysteine O-methyltransferase Ste14